MTIPVHAALPLIRHRLERVSVPPSLAGILVDLVDVVEQLAPARPADDVQPRHLRTFTVEPLHPWQWHDHYMPYVGTHRGQS